MREAKRTPGPWTVRRLDNKRDAIYAGGNQIVTVRRRSVDEAANAAFIVQACNVHDDLVEALISARKSISDALDNMPYLFPAHGISANLTPEKKAWRRKMQAASRAARTALAKVKKG